MPKTASAATFPPQQKKSLTPCPPQSPLSTRKDRNGNSRPAGVKRNPECHSVCTAADRLPANPPRQTRSPQEGHARRLHRVVDLPGILPLLSLQRRVGPLPEGRPDKDRLLR